MAKPKKPFNADATLAGATASGFKFTVSRNVTLPLWKWETGKQKVFRIETEIKIGNVTKPKGKGVEPTKVEMEPAHVAEVTNLDTKTRCQMIFGKVLQSEIEKAYPEHSYVGKCFASIQSDIPGKRYKGYTLDEIAAAE